jgi:hypothetical protein
MSRTKKSSSLKEAKEVDLSQKINHNFLKNKKEISDKTTERVLKIMQQYGEKNVIGFSWNVNHADTKASQPPSGFSFAVSENAPIKEKIFNSKKMFQATSAFLIDPVKMNFKDGSPVTFQNIMARVNRIEDGLNSTKIQETSEKSISLKLYDAEVPISTSIEKGDWTPVMGSSSSYIGLYMSDDRSNYKPKKEFWLVSQTVCPSASEDLYRLMENNSDATWLQFFGGGIQEVQFLYDSIKANRNAIISNALSSIGLEFKNPEIKHIEPTIETETNKVVRHKKTNSYVYHSGTVDPSTVKGIIFNNNPHLGPTILKGPPDGSYFGNFWDATNETFNAFPVNTGRVVNAKGKTELKVTEADLNGFAIKNKEENSNLWRLANGVYRLRDNEFKQAQYNMGYEKTWGEVDLGPVVVRISGSSD